MNGKWGLTRGNLLGGREEFPRIEKKHMERPCDMQEATDRRFSKARTRSETRRMSQDKA